MSIKTHLFIFAFIFVLLSGVVYAQSNNAGAGKPVFGVGVTSSNAPVPLGCEAKMDLDPDGCIICIADKIRETGTASLTLDELSALHYICENRNLKDISSLKWLVAVINPRLSALYESKRSDQKDEKKKESKLNVVLNFLANVFLIETPDDNITQRLMYVLAVIGEEYGSPIMVADGENGIELVKRFATEFNDETSKVAMQTLAAIKRGDIYGGSKNKQPAYSEEIGPAGTGPDGAITTSDIKNLAEGPATSVMQTADDAELSHALGGPSTSSNDPVDVLAALMYRGGYTTSQKKGYTPDCIVDLERGERGSIRDKEVYAVQMLSYIGGERSKQLITDFYNSNPANTDAENAAALVLGKDAPHAALTLVKVADGVGMITDIGLILAAGSMGSMKAIPELEKIGMMSREKTVAEAGALAEKISVTANNASNTYKFSVAISNNAAAIVLKVPPIASDVTSLAYQMWTIPSVTNQILIQDFIFTARLASVLPSSLTMIDRLNNSYMVDFSTKTISAVPVGGIGATAPKIVEVSIPLSIGKLTYQIPVATDAQAQQIINFIQALVSLNPGLSPTVSVQDLDAEATPAVMAKGKQYEALPTAQPEAANNPISDITVDPKLGKLEQALEHSGLTATQQAELLEMFKNGASLSAPIFLRGNGMTTRVSVYNNSSKSIALRISTTMDYMGAPAVTLNRTFTRGADGEVTETTTVNATGEKAVTLTASEADILAADVGAYTEMCGMDPVL